MKKRKMIILIIAAAVLLTGALVWLWYVVSEPRRLGVESHFKVEESETVFEPGIDLDVDNYDRSGKPRIRFADDGSALEFVLNAGFYIEGRLKPAKLQGWEYDAEADTLTKRYIR